MESNGTHRNKRYAAKKYRGNYTNVIRGVNNKLDGSTPQHTVSLLAQIFILLSGISFVFVSAEYVRALGCLIRVIAGRARHLKLVVAIGIFLFVFFFGN